MNEEKKTILIVDDNPVNLSVLLNFLREANFRLLVAKTGEAAIEQVEHVIPDIILMDIMMPGIDGLETCRRLKESDQTKAVPVIFMTSLTDSSEKVKAFQAGGVDYITKPIQQDEVLQRIHTHLRIAELHTQLEEGNKQLHSLNQQKDRFLSLLSNQLHSPLQDLQKSALNMSMESSQTRKQPKDLYWEVTSIESLVTVIFFWSRHTIDRLPVQAQNTNIKNLIEEVDQTLMEINGFSIRYEGLEAPTVSCPKELLKAVFSHFVAQAVLESFSLDTLQVQGSEDTENHRLVLSIRPLQGKEDEEGVLREALGVADIGLDISNQQEVRIDMPFSGGNVSEDQSTNGN